MILDNLAIIVAMTRDAVIGKDGKMPWHLPSDLAYFKRTTMGCPIVMGRKTYESIGRPLPGRDNVVISRDPNFVVPDGVRVFTDIDEALEETSMLTKLAGDGPFFVIGGAQIYKKAIRRASFLHVTHILGDIDGDTYFPYEEYVVDDTPHKHYPTFEAIDKQFVDQTLSKGDSHSMIFTQYVRV